MLLLLIIFFTFKFISLHMTYNSWNKISESEQQHVLLTYLVMSMRKWSINNMFYDCQSES